MAPVQHLQAPCTQFGWLRVLSRLLNTRELLVRAFNEVVAEKKGHTGLAFGFCPLRAARPRPMLFCPHRSPAHSCSPWPPVHGWPARTWLRAQPSSRVLGQVCWREASEASTEGPS